MRFSTAPPRRPDADGRGSIDGLKGTTPVQLFAKDALQRRDFCCGKPWNGRRLSKSLSATDLAPGLSVGKFAIVVCCVSADVCEPKGWRERVQVGCARIVLTSSWW